VAAGPGRIFSQSQRDRLLAGALEAVSEHGYPATTVGQIVVAARISRGTFYEHFANKEECVLATYDLIVDWLGEQIAAALAGVESWQQAVRIAVGVFLARFDADPRLANLCTIEILQIDRLGPVRHEDAIERLAIPLRAGRARSPWGTRLPFTLEQTLIGGAIWLVARRSRHDQPLELTTLSSEITCFLLVPYIGASQARQVAQRP
jgi:AcrR family transcriptional regulator